MRRDVVWNVVLDCTVEYHKKWDWEMFQFIGVDLAIVRTATGYGPSEGLLSAKRIRS